MSLVVFVAYEARRTEPLLDPRFFRSAPFAGSVVTAITAFAATGGFLFLATLYLQDALGMSALYAGLHMLPMAVVMDSRWSWWREMADQLAHELAAA